MAASANVSTFLAEMVPHSNVGGEGGPNRSLIRPVFPFWHVYLPTPLVVEIEGPDEPQAWHAALAPLPSATVQPQQLGPSPLASPPASPFAEAADDVVGHGV